MRKQDKKLIYESIMKKVSDMIIDRLYEYNLWTVTGYGLLDLQEVFYNTEALEDWSEEEIDALLDQLKEIINDNSLFEDDEFEYMFTMEFKNDNDPDGAYYEDEIYPENDYILIDAVEKLPTVNPIIDEYTVSQLINNIKSMIKIKIKRKLIKWNDDYDNALDY